MRPLFPLLTFILFISIFTPSCQKDAAGSTKPKSTIKVLDSLSLLKGDSTTFAWAW
jgi:hypothetical protein